MGRRNAAQLKTHREQASRYRTNRPEMGREGVRNTRQRKRGFVVEVLGTACVQCCEDRDGAVEYHHPGGGGWRRGLYDHSWADLKEEVMNIIPLCGTCHNLAHRGI